MTQEVWNGCGDRQPVRRAETQYNDFVGTAAADGHAGPVGLDLGRYKIVGLEFSRENLLNDGLTILAIDREDVGDSIDEYHAAHGELPVTDFIAPATDVKTAAAALGNSPEIAGKHYIEPETPLPNPAPARYLDVLGPAATNPRPVER